MDSGTLPDLSQLGAQAGLTGAMTFLVTQLVKALTGWQERRAIAAAAVVALGLALLAWGATHWRVLQEVWQVVTNWLGSLAAASGLYGFGRKQPNGAAQAVSEPSGEPAAPRIRPLIPPSAVVLPLLAAIVLLALSVAPVAAR
jgi:hypothetical protein